MFQVYKRIYYFICARCGYSFLEKSELLVCSYCLKTFGNGKEFVKMLTENEYLEFNRELKLKKLTDESNSN